jgi:CubicO group peptidase (beta-lactamase class C family)
VACGSADQNIQAVLERTIAQHDIPAIVAITLQGGEIVEAGVAGVRVRGGDAAATLNDYWHLGSCTKAMTASMAARLVEQDTIDWDSTISTVLPDLVDGMHAAYREVTLVQLLTHRGGLPKDMIGTEEWKRAWKRTGSSHEQQLGFVKDVLAMAPVGPVGEFVYSNQGYAIAGYMCEVAAGETYENLMHREVFGPLGMESAGWGAPLTRGVEHPNGHKDDGKPSRPHGDNPVAISAAGRVHCTMADWARFVASHLDRGKSQDALLEPATFNTLHSPASGPGNSYALGWGVAQRGWGGGTVLTHGGSNTMFYCVVWVAPERDFAVLVACNQGGDTASKACDEVASACITRTLRK